MTSLQLRKVPFPAWLFESRLLVPGDAWLATRDANGTAGSTGRWTVYPDGPHVERGDLVIAREHRSLLVVPICLVLPYGAVVCLHSQDGRVSGDLDHLNQLSTATPLRWTVDGVAWLGLLKRGRLLYAVAAT